MLRLLGFILLVACQTEAQPKRVLYVTHSAGYRHDCLPSSADVLKSIAALSGALEVTHTEDLSLLSAASLANFDAVFFYTSGELALSDSQKRDLLAFVHDGKGFAGAHSATDTLYGWPEYGELIGARFKGHPWVQEVRLDIEDPEHPAVAHLRPSFVIVDEIYQFSEFSRDRARVLLSLDPRSVDLNAPGTNPNTEDFPIAWCRNYGAGRVFYTALGYFEETWRNPQFQRTLLEAMLWITGQADGAAAPRPSVQPVIHAEGVANSASFEPPMTISPGSLISIFGNNLTSGSTLAADAGKPLTKLAGSVVKLNGAPIPILYASPNLINAFVPLESTPEFELTVSTAGVSSAAVRPSTAESTPGIFAVTVHEGFATIWATGLGSVTSTGFTRNAPAIRINNVPAEVLFSGLAPGWFGLYQVNVRLPANLALPASMEFSFGAYRKMLAIP